MWKRELSGIFSWVTLTAWTEGPGRGGRHGEARADPPRVETAKTWEHLEAFVREHVQQFIQALLEEEVTELLGRTKSARREAVYAVQGYRNGYGKPRQLTLTSGTITVRRPRIRDLNERVVSRVLPLFKRQTKEVGELLPQLYLHGLALGDFELALRGLLGEGAPLSPASLLRLKTQWQAEYETWKRRRLDDLEVVYLWADGLYVKAGLEDTKAALLVMIGVLTNGQKVVLAVESGQRESKESWGMILRDLRKRGLKPWRCTIADGHLGWNAWLWKGGAYERTHKAGGLTHDGSPAERSIQSVSEGGCGISEQRGAFLTARRRPGV